MEILPQEGTELVQNTRACANSTPGDQYSQIKNPSQGMHAASDIKPLLEGVEVDAELMAFLIIERDQEINFKN